MKRAVLTILVLIAALAVMLPAGAAPACALEAGTYEVLLDGTAIYAEPDTASAVLATLDKDTKIFISDTQTTNNIDWCLTFRNGRTGYVRASALYVNHEPQSFVRRYARISKDKKGDDIYLLSAPSADASKLTELNDGSRVLLTGYETDGYLEIQYNEVKGYIPSENIVTSGFTYHQYLAVLVGVVCLASVIAIGVLARANKKKESK